MFGGYMGIDEAELKIERIKTDQKMHDFKNIDDKSGKLGHREVKKDASENKKISSISQNAFIQSKQL